MNRKYWNQKFFAEEDINQIPCPNCFHGRLTLESQNRKLIRNQNKHAKSTIPSNNYFIVTGFLQCTNQKCNNIISFVADLEEAFIMMLSPLEGKQEINSEMRYFFQYLYPNLRLFDLNSHIPDKVIQQVDLSFASYFSDYSSSANRIRNSIEIILNEIKAPKKARNHRGKMYEFSNLHSRIENYKNKINKTLGELMMANKIIGNAGSHIGILTQEDLLDAYDILDLILQKLFVKPEASTKDLANIILDKNKPRSQ